MTRQPSPALVACAAGAVIAVAVLVLRLDPPRTTMDFLSFYDSASAVVSGQPLYELRTSTTVAPNLNPPTLVLLMAPLASLPIGLAHRVWQLLGAISVVASVIAIGRRLGWPVRALLAAVLALTVWYPSMVAWAEGQVTWLLLYPMTRAWAARSRAASGVWLGLAIAIKPPLALVALMLSWRIWIVAGAVSAAISLAAVAATGVQPWLDWLALSRSVAWINWPLNASLWGIVSRLDTGQLQGWAMQDATWPVVLGVSLALAWCAWRTVRTENRDARWTAAVLFHGLASPAGWIYYLPTAIGPALASWRSSSTIRIAIALLAVPMPLLGVMVRTAPTGVRILGSGYAIAALLLWWRWTRRDDRQARQRNAVPSK